MKRRKLLSVLLICLLALEITGISVLAVSAPAIVIMAASDVAKTTAQLNSIVTDDGDEDCDVRWGYGTTSQGDVDDYDTTTAWDTTGYNTGEHPYLEITGLNADDEYFYMVEIRNSDSAVESGELTLDTEATIANPSDFRGVPSATSISLSWTMGAGTSQSLVRYRHDTYPTTETDGTQAYLGSSSTYTHTGLTSGKTYYYSVWGESGGGYSAGYVSVVVTTTSTPAVDEDLPIPGAFTGWMQAPDPTAFEDFGLVYIFGNNFADAWEVPRATFWLAAYLLFCVCAVGLAFMVNGSLLGASVLLIVSLSVGVTMELLPFWIAIATAIYALGLGVAVMKGAVR